MPQTPDVQITQARILRRFNAPAPKKSFAISSADAPQSSGAKGLLQRFSCKPSSRNVPKRTL
jgi:hypothetical protein